MLSRILWGKQDRRGEKKQNESRDSRVVPFLFTPVKSKKERQKKEERGRRKTKKVQKKEASAFSLSLSPSLL